MRTKGLLIAQRNRLKAKILESMDVIGGSVVESYRTCGKPGCRCQEGERHGPYYLLSWYEEGKTRTCHIPKEKLAEVKRMTANYVEVREALKKLSELNRRLLLEVD
ncbi:MAG: DUF6788 family protein [Bacillota bacterium]